MAQSPTVGPAFEEGRHLLKFPSLAALSVDSPDFNRSELSLCHPLSSAFVCLSVRACVCFLVWLNPPLASSPHAELLHRARPTSWKQRELSG